MAARIALRWAITLCLMAVMSGCAMAESQPDITSLFALANEAFAAGDYARAISLYTSALETGVEDASIFSNLAAAYYRSGDLAGALLNYRRAEQYSPRDPDLVHNLALVRGSRQAVVGDETGFFEGLAAFCIRLVTLDEQVILTWMIWMGWFGLATGWLLANERSRRAIRPFLFVLSGLLLVALLALGNRWLLGQYRPEVIVRDTDLAVYSGPGDQYLRLFRLTAAVEGRVMQHERGWIRLRLPDGRQGWVEAAGVEAIMESR